MNYIIFDMNNYTIGISAVIGLVLGLGMQDSQSQSI